MSDRPRLPLLSWLLAAIASAALVIWILARPIVDSIDFPIIGFVPIPFVALLGSILVGYLLARLLGLHAGWVGRRWADRVGERVTAAIRDEVTGRVLAPLDRLEDARRRLSISIAAVVSGCDRD